MRKILKGTRFFELLKNRNFLAVWLTQVFSLTTAHMLNFILMERIFRISGSTVAIGLFYALYYLPTVIFGPFVGVLIDRWNKKEIFIFSNLSQAFIVLLYLGLKEEIWPIYTIALLYSLCDEFLNPTIGASLPAVVQKETLPMANGFFFLTTHTAIGGGYLLGGLLLRFLRNNNLIFVLASIILLFASVMATKISGQVLKRKKKVRFKWAHFQEKIIEGYLFIKNEPRVLFPILLLAGLQILVGMSILLLPSISQQILEIAFAYSPFVIIVPIFLGLALGNFLVERFLRVYRKKNLISLGLFLTGFLILALDLAVPVFPFRLFLAGSLALGLGFAYIIMFIPCLTLVQENTLFSLRGRVFSTLSTLVTLAAAVPMLLTATLVDLFGVRAILIAASLGIIALGFYARKGKYGLLVANHRS